MMLTLRVQKLTQLLQRSSSKLDFMALAATLQGLIPGSSVYIFNRSGKVLGFSLAGGVDGTPFDAAWLKNGFAPEAMNTAMLAVGAPSIGVEAKRILGEPSAGLFPIIGDGQRVGTLLITTAEIDDAALVLAEFAATAIGWYLSQKLGAEEEDRLEERRAAHLAISSLSYSEILAIQLIFDELDGDEGLLVASRIADEAGMTRSVIVNALRKLASANVIESRSLGMKGTYIRIVNKEIRKEINRHRLPYPKPPALARKEA